MRKLTNGKVKSPSLVLIKKACFRVNVVRIDLEHRAPVLNLNHMIKVKHLNILNFPKSTWLTDAIYRFCFKSSPLWYLSFNFHLGTSQIRQLVGAALMLKLICCYCSNSAVCSDWFIYIYYQPSSILRLIGFKPKILNLAQFRSCTLIWPNQIMAFWWR